MSTSAASPQRTRGRRYEQGFIAPLFGIVAVLCFFTLSLNGAAFMTRYYASSLLYLPPTNDASDDIQTRNISETFPPISCSQVLQQFQAEANTTDPNGGKLFVRHTLTDPSFWISFHDGSYDPVRISTFTYGYYYEKALTAAFEQVLSQTLPPNGTKHRVIGEFLCLSCGGNAQNVLFANTFDTLADVGMNIGWFSLLAAANGAEVTAFEPNPKNYLRTCESMRLNGWLPCSSGGSCLDPGKSSVEEFHSRIHVYPYGVSNKQGEMLLLNDEHNPGKAKVVSVRTNMTQALRVVSLDYLANDLGWLDSDIEILKVDVEGEELGVFEGAKELLRSKRVQNLFMEGGGHGPAVHRRFKQIVGLLVDSGYEIHKIGGFRGPNSPMTAAPSGSNVAEFYFERCMKVGRKSQQCNLWWKPAL